MHIRQLRELSPGMMWCILRDFNSIRSPAERVGLSQRGENERNVEEFNEWISDLQVDCTLCGEKIYMVQVKWDSKEQTG